MDAQMWVNGETAEVKAVIANGRQVAVYDLDFRGAAKPSEPSVTYTLPCPVFSAHMNAEGSMIVCGGEDNLLYRVDANSGEVLGKSRPP